MRYCIYKHNKDTRQVFFEEGQPDPLLLQIWAEVI